MKEFLFEPDEAARKLNEFGYTIFPLSEKKPAVRNWKKFIGKAQKPGEINKLFRRYGITGYGIIIQNNLRVLDIDGTQDMKIVNDLLRLLGLTKSYRHLIKSGNGYHIYFYCRDDKKLVEKYFGSDKAYYKINIKIAYELKQVELRWANCYMVGPYSMHPTGKKYKYANGEPEKPATDINPEKLIKAIEVIRAPQKDERMGDQKNIRYDEKQIKVITNYLKKIKLEYYEWIECGFALAQMGEKGRKYFLILSTNKFYPQDTKSKINKQYDELLKRYQGNKITIGTLFYIADKYGYKKPGNKKRKKAEFLEFELCVLSYKEKNKDKLLKIIQHYAQLKKMGFDDLSTTRKKEQLALALKKSKIYDDKKTVISNYNLMKRFVNSFIRKYGNEPYCRIGEDLMRETIQRKFDYLTFTIVCGVTAVQGKTAGWKIISKERIRAAIKGYKSITIYTKENEEKETISDFQIRERVKRLRDAGILRSITLYRNTYYSTFLTMKQLSEIAHKRYNDNYRKKCENDAIEMELKNNTKADKSIIKNEVFQRLNSEMEKNSSKRRIIYN